MGMVNAMRPQSIHCVLATACLVTPPLGQASAHAIFQEVHCTSTCTEENKVEPEVRGSSPNSEKAQMPGLGRASVLTSGTGK